MDFQGATSVLVGYMIYHCECLMQGYLPRKLVLTRKRSEMEKTLWNPYRNCCVYWFPLFPLFFLLRPKFGLCMVICCFSPFFVFLFVFISCPLSFIFPALTKFWLCMCLIFLMMCVWYFDDMIFLVFMFLIFLCFLICAYVSFFGAFLSHGVSQIIQVMNDHNLSIETNGDDWGSPILGNPHFRL